MTNSRLSDNQMGALSPSAMDWLNPAFHLPFRQRAINKPAGRFVSFSQASHRVEL
jgi:hypothetical protein